MRLTTSSKHGAGLLELLHRDNLTLELQPDGRIRIDGPQGAAETWKPIILQYRPAIALALSESRSKAVRVLRRIAARSKER